MMYKLQLVLFVSVLCMFEIVASEEEEEPIEGVTNLTNDAEYSTTPESSAESIYHESTVPEKLLTKEGSLPKSKAGIHRTSAGKIQNPTLSGNKTKENTYLRKSEPDFQEGRSKQNSNNDSSLKKPTPPAGKSDIISRLFKHFDVNDWDQLHEKLPMLKSSPSENFLKALQSDSNEPDPSVESHKIDQNTTEKPLSSPEGDTDPLKKADTTDENTTVDSFKSSKSEDSSDNPQNKSESLPVSSKQKNERKNKPSEPMNTNDENTTLDDSGNSLRETSDNVLQNKPEELLVPRDNLTESGKSVPKPIDGNHEHNFPEQTKMEVEDDHSKNKTSDDRVEEYQTDDIDVFNNGSTEDPQAENLSTAEYDEIKSTQIETTTTTERSGDKEKIKESETSIDDQDFLIDEKGEGKENLTRNSENTVNLRGLQLGDKYDKLKAILRSSGTDKLVYDPSVYNRNYLSPALIEKPHYSPRFKPLPLPFLYGGMNKTRNRKNRVQQPPQISMTSNNPPQIKSNTAQKQTQSPSTNQTTVNIKPESDFVSRKIKTPKTEDTVDHMKELKDTKKPIVKSENENEMLNQDKAVKAKESGKQNKGDENKLEEIKPENATAKIDLTHVQKESNSTDKSELESAAAVDSVKSTNMVKKIPSETNRKDNTTMPSNKELNSTGKETVGEIDSSVKNVTQVILDKIAKLEALINQTSTGKHENTTFLKELLNQNVEQDNVTSTNEQHVQNKLTNTLDGGKNMSSSDEVNRKITDSPKLELGSKDSFSVNKDNLNYLNKSKTKLNETNKIPEKTEKINETINKDQLESKPEETKNGQEEIQRKNELNDDENHILNRNKSFKNMTQVLIDKIAHLEKLINQTNSDINLHPKLNSTLHDDSALFISDANKNKTILQESTTNKKLEDQNSTDHSPSKHIHFSDSGQNKKSNAQTFENVEETDDDEKSYTDNDENINFNSSSQPKENSNFSMNQRNESSENKANITTAKPFHVTTTKPDRTQNDIDKEQISDKSKKINSETIPIESLQSITQIIFDKINHLEELINRTSTDKNSGHKEDATLNNKPIAVESNVLKNKIDKPMPPSLLKEEIEKNHNTNSTLLRDKIDQSAPTKTTVHAIPTDYLKVSPTWPTSVPLEDRNLSASNLTSHNSSRKSDKGNFPTTVTPGITFTHEQKQVSQQSLDSNLLFWTKPPGSVMNIPKPTIPMYAKLKNWTSLNASTLTSSKVNKEAAFRKVSNSTISKHSTAETHKNPSFNFTSKLNPTSSPFVTVSKPVVFPKVNISTTLNPTVTENPNATVKRKSNTTNPKPLRLEGEKSSSPSRSKASQNPKNTKSVKVPGTLETLISIVKKLKTSENMGTVNLGQRQPSMQPRKYPPPENDFSTFPRYFTPPLFHPELANRFENQDFEDSSLNSVSPDFHASNRRSSPRSDSEQYYFQQLKPGFKQYHDPSTRNFQHIFSHNPSYTGFPTTQYYYGNSLPQSTVFSRRHNYQPWNRNIGGYRSAYHSPDFVENSIWKYNQLVHNRFLRFLSRINRQQKFRYQSPLSYDNYFSEPNERTYPRRFW